MLLIQLLIIDNSCHHIEQFLEAAFWIETHQFVLNMETINKVFDSLKLPV